MSQNSYNTPPSADASLSVVDWILAILCSGIGCILGIVYVIQGKPKGMKMVGISILFAILGGIISVVMQMAAQPQ